MNAAAIAALAIAIGVVALLVWIVLACRTPKARTREHPHSAALIKSMPSFDIYSAKDQRSLRIAAASARR